MQAAHMYGMNGTNWNGIDWNGAAWAAANYAYYQQAGIPFTGQATLYRMSSISYNHSTANAVVASHVALGHFSQATLQAAPPQMAVTATVRATAPAASASTNRVFAAITPVPVTPSPVTPSPVALGSLSLVPPPVFVPPVTFSTTPSMPHQNQITEEMRAQAMQQQVVELRNVLKTIPLSNDNDFQSYIYDTARSFIQTYKEWFYNEVCRRARESIQNPRFFSFQPHYGSAAPKMQHMLIQKFALAVCQILLDEQQEGPHAVSISNFSLSEGTKILPLHLCLVIQRITVGYFTKYILQIEQHMNSHFFNQWVKLTEEYREQMFPLLFRLIEYRKQIAAMSDADKVSLRHFFMCLNVPPHTISYIPSHARSIFTLFLQHMSMRGEAPSSSYSFFPLYEFLCHLQTV